jgi:hypothetical protein
MLGYASPRGPPKSVISSRSSRSEATTETRHRGRRCRTGATVEAAEPRLARKARIESSWPMRRRESPNHLNVGGRPRFRRCPAMRMAVRAADRVLHSSWAGGFGEMGKTVSSRGIRNPSDGFRATLEAQHPSFLRAAVRVGGADELLLFIEDAAIRSCAGIRRTIECRKRRRGIQRKPIA